MASRSTDVCVRLILDEHLSPSIAVELRRLEHDAIAVAERDELRGRTDVEIFAEASVSGRAVVTFDVGDYLPLVHRAVQLQRRHSGLILLSPARAWSRREASGQLVAALAKLMRDNPADDAFSDRVEWLERETR